MASDGVRLEDNGAQACHVRVRSGRGQAKQRAAHLGRLLARMAALLRRLHDDKGRREQREQERICAATAAAADEQEVDIGPDRLSAFPEHNSRSKANRHEQKQHKQQNTGTRQRDERRANNINITGSNNNKHASSMRVITTQTGRE